MSKKGDYSLLTFVLSPDDVRRLGRDQAEEVEKLTLRTTHYLFGDTSVYNHLDKRFLSLGIYNEMDELAGVLCMDIYPNIPALPPWEWDSWLYDKYKLEDIEPINTLWIHYAVWDRRYTSLFLKPILQYAFQAYEPLENVIMICPPGITHLDFIDSCSTRVLPEGYYIAHKIQTLFICNKSNFVPQYVIRRAVEEDSDDLVAIIPKVLEETYGQFYISELLNNEDSERQIIVAEHQGCAVGILCLNERVDYDLLNQEFELIPFNGLKKHNVADELTKTQAPTSNTFLPEPDSTERISYFATEETKDEVIIKEEEDNISEDEFSLVNLSSSLILNFLYEDEELSDNLILTESVTSIESHFSAVILNEDYQDHLYNVERSEVEGDEKRPKRRDSKPEDLPVFYGEEDAFVMEICTSVPDHETCLYLLFQAAFECFPDRDYIVVSFPTDSNASYLSQHFVRVVPRPNSVFPHELYILHRSSILGKLWARPSQPEDIKPMCNLTSSLIKPSAVEDILKEATEIPSSPFKAYTFMCEKQIIGCAVVSEEEEHEYLQVYYNVESWIDTRGNKFGTIGCLEQFLLSPIFQKHTAFFAREVHRLSNFDTFVYRLKRLDYMYTYRNLPIINAISNMTPVLPNQLPEYSKQIVEEYQLPDCLQKHHQPCGLYISTIRLTSTIRVEVHQKIVIVGAGTTTIAFLEALLFGNNPNYHIYFTNVTVVSPHGITYHKQPSEIRDMVFVSDGHLTRKYIDSICLKTYVHVVTGVMSLINRKEKYIALNDDTYITYDYLFLLCGEQFQKPPLKRKEIIKNKKTDFPQNVFIINTEADAGNAFNALKNLHSEKKQGAMVVFGHYLEAICCLAALLELGVAGNNLIYVDPSPDPANQTERHEHLTQFFNNSVVETAVLDEILAQGITIYQDYNFVEWHLDSKGTYITSAKFESKYKFIEIELAALFIYHSKGVSTRTFQAIARSGLVFNGRLIIDENYQTNDPCIYGAGPLTMYSKKYHAEHLMHKFYNATEIGNNLGREIRKKLVPETFWDPPVKPQRMHKPVVKHCRFPGNLHYLHIAKPGEPAPLDVVTIKCNYGRVLTTGDCKRLDLKGYFRLHLNQFQKIETITCLAKFKLHVRNLTSLWGKHESLLNHLLWRFDSNMIPDLFAYFNQPWAAALYHRSFPKVLDEISEIFESTLTSEGVKLIDEVRSRLEHNDWQQLTKMQIDEIEELCRDTNLTPTTEKKVLEFLHDNYMYLPMYVHQLLIRWVMHQVKLSPLFIKTVLLTNPGDETEKRTQYFAKRQRGSSDKAVLFKY